MCPHKTFGSQREHVFQDTLMGESVTDAPDTVIVGARRLFAPKSVSSLRFRYEKFLSDERKVFDASG